MGGIVVVAHLFLTNPDLVFAYLEPLIEAGLDGADATCTYSKTNYKGNLMDAHLRQLIIEKYSNTNLFISGRPDHPVGRMLLINRTLIGRISE